MRSELEPPLSGCINLDALCWLAQISKLFSEVRVHAGTTWGVWMWIPPPPPAPADTLPKRLLITMVKEMVKKKFWKMEKPEHLWRSMSNIDKDANDCACEDACVKVTNVKSVKKCSPGGRSQAAASTSCVSWFIASGEVRWHLLIVCGAPRPTAWRGNTFFCKPSGMKKMQASRLDPNSTNLNYQCLTVLAKSWSSTSRHWISWYLTKWPHNCYRHNVHKKLVYNTPYANWVCTYRAHRPVMANTSRLRFRRAKWCFVKTARLL